MAQVQAAAAWAAETGAAGDLVLSAALHRFDGSDGPVRLVASEEVVTAYTLVADLLADMGAQQPHVLTSEGDILIDRLNADHRRELRFELCPAPQSTGPPTARSPHSHADADQTRSGGTWRPASSA